MGEGILAPLAPLLAGHRSEKAGGGIVRGRTTKAYVEVESGERKVESGKWKVESGKGKTGRWKIATAQ